MIFRDQRARETGWGITRWDETNEVVNQEVYLVWEVWVPEEWDSNLLGNSVVDEVGWEATDWVENLESNF